jgi:SAM-dependent methyltransferase
MPVHKKHLAELAAYSGDPWVPENEYFAHAERFIETLWSGLIWPMLQNVDFRSVLDLAAGHGRNSTKLIDLCESLVIMDIQPGNVEICRKRFGDGGKVSYHVGNGYDLRPVADETITLVYCFDAMVHFDSDIVRSYLADTRRVLKDGAHGFFHHSNYTGGDDWRVNPQGRNFMSKDLFAHYARKEGLEIVAQQLVDWAGEAALDVFSLVRRGDT